MVSSTASVAALFTLLRSRHEHTFGEKILSERFDFGGHLDRMLRQK